MQQDRIHIMLVYHGEGTYAGRQMLYKTSKRDGVNAFRTGSFPEIDLYTHYKENRMHKMHIRF